MAHRGLAVWRYESGSRTADGGPTPHLRTIRTCLVRRCDRYDPSVTLPGNRLPHEALPRHSAVPAEEASLAPVWCPHRVRWSYVGEQGGYVCDDPDHYDGPPAVQSGAIDVDHQPTYGACPSDVLLDALREDRGCV